MTWESSTAKTHSSTKAVMVMKTTLPVPRVPVSCLGVSVVVAGAAEFGGTVFVRVLR